MSIDKCIDCSRAVDTDEDDGSYFVTLIGGKEINTEVCRCGSCRIDPWLLIGLTNADIKKNLAAIGTPEWHAANKMPVNEAAPDDRAAIDP